MTSLRTVGELWNQLTGVVCIYKPPKYSWNGLKRIIRQMIMEEINPLVPRKGIPYEYNPLVVGPLVTRERLPMYSTLMDTFSSGVAVVGLRTAWTTVCTHTRRSPVKVYHVKGQLGIATDTFDTYGLVRERASFYHVRKEIIDTMASTLQAAYQRSMFDACGVHPQSQAAYEMAVNGLIRPTDREIPVFYGIKCIDFEPPEFTLEIQCINEKALFIKRIIQDIGFRLRTVATCSGIRCIRYGPFTVEHALPRHNWHVETFFDNMETSTKMLITDLYSDRLKNPSLISAADESWEETENKLVARKIIKRPKSLKPPENDDDNALNMLPPSETVIVNKNQVQT